MRPIAKYRVTRLKIMHDFMCHANDERLYMTWIECGVPDCPCDEDFEYIADNDDCYKECCDLFRKLVAKKGWE